MPDWFWTVGFLSCSLTAIIISENSNLGTFVVNKWLFITAGIIGAIGGLFPLVGDGEWSFAIYLEYNLILVSVHVISWSTFNWKSVIMFLAFVLFAPILTALFIYDDYILRIMLPSRTKTPL